MAFYLLEGPRFGSDPDPESVQKSSQTRSNQFLLTGHVATSELFISHTSISTLRSDYFNQSSDLTHLTLGFSYFLIGIFRLDIYELIS